MSYEYHDIKEEMEKRRMFRGLTGCEKIFWGLTLAIILLAMLF